MTTEQTKSFILAGRAIFTVSNGRPAPLAADYTFKVTRKDPDPATAIARGNLGRRDTVYFVALLTGSDNENDYSYLGILDAATGRVRTTAKSKFTEDSKPVIALGWALGLLWAGRELPGGATLQHAGRCGKCARLLTVPESIESGLGPECSGLGYTKPRNERKPRAKKAAKPTFAEQRAATAAANLANDGGLGLPAALTPAQQRHEALNASIAATAEHLRPLPTEAERDADRATDLDLSDVEIDPRVEASLFAADPQARAEAFADYLLDANGLDSVDRAERDLGVE